MINSELADLKEFLQYHGHRLDDYEIWGQDTKPGSTITLGDLRAIYEEVMSMRENSKSFEDRHGIPRKVPVPKKTIRAASAMKDKTGPL